MMAKKITKDVSAEIKGLLKEGKLVIGTSSVLKGLRSGRISRVFVSSNCPADVKEDIDNYSKLAGAEIVQLKYPNEELGDMCKKPFSISVLGVSKE
ncbi:50S ribosomal protein L30 [Candidatus Woesearchaeota archaeon]|nr:50S ribosomal protein L30 [Candidatus Woesearchaeota archaeon]